MYLKRMELFGFKSFAEKSELDLDSGIVAVIGPNGCGKSNLVDAVRWALGEQSVKSLRGTRMEEVIFSGTEDRKALNFAEVSLNFGQAGEFLGLDYDEVTITRRLFRNGESEYYINKSPCRLKDITELFLDTGLGKEVYSVIGQGRVDEIINSRPDERRDIFEEAAGILKYKLRKKEARRRLEETRDNLVRVQDLIYELETQVEPLQEQAKITRQYRDLKQRIAEQEKKLLSYRLSGSRDQLNKINSQLEGVSDALLATAAESGLHEERRQELKGRLQQLLEQKKGREKTLAEVSSSLDQREGERVLLVERHNRFREIIEQDRQRILQLDQQMADLDKRRKQTAGELKERRAALGELEQELQEIRREQELLEKNSSGAKVEEHQEKIYDLNSRREADLSTIQELERRLVRLDAHRVTLEEEGRSLRDCQVEITERAHLLDTKFEQVKAKHAEALDREQRALAEEHSQQKTLERERDKGQQIRQEMHGVESRLTLLREQDAALSGYYRGVREVINARPPLPGIIGPVADLVSVQEQHLGAVEAALGGTLQYLVAVDEKAVHTAINYLKEKNLGWATFLPLDILRQGSDPLERFPGWQNLQGVIGRLSDLIESDSAVRKAIDYLAFSTMVCSDISSASGAARFVKHSARVVTLEGELINPGGVIRGGSVPRRNAGLPLGRRREIEALEVKLAELNRVLEAAGAKIDAEYDKLTAQNEKVMEAAKRRQVLEQELQLAGKESGALEVERTALEDKLKGHRTALDSLDSERQEITGRLKVLAAEIDKTENKRKALERELAGSREEHHAYLEKKKELEQRLTDNLVRSSSCREQCEALAQRIAELEQGAIGPAQEKVEKEREESEYQEKLEANLAEQVRLKTLTGDINEKKAALIAALEEHSAELNRVEADLIELEEEGRRRQARISRQEKRERQLSLEQTRLQTEINYQEMRFREQFHSLELAAIDDTFEPEESSHLVENLKEDLEGLGEVNLGAIEELNRLEDRISFLANQRGDLNRGEASLRKVLAEIDQRMEFYFNIAFESINENFMQTFQELFEGGTVVLKLTDPENILEAGVEIIAQPPGKKLQNINLLSAGEKVLTAIALVFAILRFKPAPFYLLDEVESNLDDANLTRFTRFLKQSARQAQFILITHRKRTMEEAEVLYGVTMPEPGVSRLMSLKLENNLISEAN